MNWGHKIALFFTAFVIFMLYLVYRTFTVEFHLVADDYYARELKFQEQIDKTANANALPEKVQVRYEGRKVEIQFPQNLLEQGVEGEALFFRPSDARLDTRFELKPNAEGIQEITSDKLVSGMYQLQLEWKSGDKAYYKETQIFLQ